jgi:hypothetical protein
MKKVFLNSANTSRTVNGIYTFELSEELQKNYTEVAVEQFTIQQGTPNFSSINFNYYRWNGVTNVTDGITVTAGSLNNLKLNQLAVLTNTSTGALLNQALPVGYDAWFSYATVSNLLTFNSTSVFSTTGSWIEPANYITKRLCGNRDSRQIITNTSAIRFTPREDYQIGLHSDILIDSDKNLTDSSGLLCSALINNNNEYHRIVERNYPTLNFQKFNRLNNFLNLYLSDLDDPTKTPRTDVPFWAVTLVFR